MCSSNRNNLAAVLGLLPTALEFSLVVDNAKSHSDKNTNNHKNSDSGDRRDALCESFRGGGSARRKIPRFNRWATQEKQKMTPNNNNSNGRGAAPLSTAPPLSQPQQRKLPADNKRCLLSSDDDDDDDETMESRAVRPPPLGLNAHMPQRQDSEDPELIQALLASLDEFQSTTTSSSSSLPLYDGVAPRRGPRRRPARRPPSLLDDSDDDDDGNGEREDNFWASAAAARPPCPSSMVNALQPVRQQSEDPEMVLALLNSLKEK